MVVVQCSEEVEGVPLSIPGIEKDNLIPAGTIVFLVAVQEIACTKVGIDIANPVKEDIRPDKAVIYLVDMLHDLGVDILHELVAVGQVMENLCDLLRHLLVLVQCIAQQGRVLAEGLSLHKTAKLLEDIEREDVDIVSGTLDALLDGGNLVTHQVFLITGIQVEIEIVEEVSTLCVLEGLAAELVVQLLNGHWSHKASCLICSILYPGRKQA